MVDFKLKAKKLFEKTRNFFTIRKVFSIFIFIVFGIPILLISLIVSLILLILIILATLGGGFRVADTINHLKANLKYGNITTL